MKKTILSMVLGLLLISCGNDRIIYFPGDRIGDTIYFEGEDLRIEIKQIVDEEENSSIFSKIREQQIVIKHPDKLSDTLVIPYNKSADSIYLKYYLTEMMLVQYKGVKYFVYWGISNNNECFKEFLGFSDLRGDWLYYLYGDMHSNEFSYSQGEFWWDEIDIDYIDTRNSIRIK